MKNSRAIQITSYPTGALWAPLNTAYKSLGYLSGTLNMAACVVQEAGADLSRALSVLTVRIYIQINIQALELCHQVQCITPETATPDIRGSAAFHSCVTWSPKGAIFFTLMRVHGDSLVYCHENDTLYLASPQATLAASCQDDVGFLAQYCEDDGNVPRLLVFDLISSKVGESADAKARGDSLRTLAGVLPSPLCTVQWVGWVNPLRKFVESLPHRVRYFLELTKNPGVLIQINPW